MEDSTSTVIEIVDRAVGSAAHFHCGIRGQPCEFGSLTELARFLERSRELANQWDARQDAERLHAARKEIVDFLHKASEDLKNAEPTAVATKWAVQIRAMYESIQNRISTVTFHAKRPVAAVLADNKLRALGYDKQIKETLEGIADPMWFRRVGQVSAYQASTLGLSQTLDVLAALGFLDTQNEAMTMSAKLDDTERLASQAHIIAEKVQTQLKGLVAQRASEAPASHWEDRRRHHEDAARSAFRVLIGVIVLTIAAAVGLAFILTSASKVGGSESPLVITHWLSKQIPIAVVGVTVLGIGVWSIRLAARYYTSHSHMIRIAGEKIAMCETFVTLSKAKLIDTSQWSVILAAIFRDTPDGLVDLPEGPHSLPELLFASASIKPPSNG